MKDGYSFPIAPIAKQLEVTIRVTGVRQFQLRCTAMIWLLRLAAWIGPVTTHVEVEQ